MDVKELIERTRGYRDSDIVNDTITKEFIFEHAVLKNGKPVKCGIKYCPHYASQEVKNGWICLMHKQLLGNVSLASSATLKRGVSAKRNL